MRLPIFNPTHFALWISKRAPLVAYLGCQQCQISTRMRHFRKGAISLSGLTFMKGRTRSEIRHLKIKRAPANSQTARFHIADFQTAGSLPIFRFRECQSQISLRLSAKSQFWLSGFLYNYQGERRRYALPKKAPNWRANNRLGPPTLFHLYCYAKEINSL